MTKLENTYETSLEIAHALIGGKWKLRILWNIEQGNNRFSQLKKVLPNITEKMLYTNLRELEDRGILKKEVIREQKPQIIIYNIENKYTKLESMIKLIHEFTEEYVEINKIK